MKDQTGVQIFVWSIILFPIPLHICIACITIFMCDDIIILGFNDLGLIVTA